MVLEGASAESHPATAAKSDSRANREITYIYPVHYRL